MKWVMGQNSFLASHINGATFDLGNGTDALINFAGKCRGIVFNMNHPAEMIADNLEAAIDAFKAALRMNVRRVVNFGSTCAYSPSVQSPFRPEDYLKGDPEPTNGPYAYAKRVIYTMSRAYAEQYAMDNLYLIMPNLYGPRDRFGDDGHVIPSMIKKVDEAIRKDLSSVTFYGTGIAEREFLYVKDAARLVVMASDSVHSKEPVHLTSGETISIRDLAGLICGLMGYKGQILWDATRPDGQLKRLLSKGLQLEKPTSLAEGLCQTIAWYKEERELKTVA